jgi:type IV pilus assembly protein PilM
MISSGAHADIQPMRPTMRNFLSKRHGPIGIDLGSRSVKLLQFNSDRTQLLASARIDLPAGRKMTAEEHDNLLVDALRQARQGEEFRGRDAVICLGARELYLQNIRIAKAATEETDKLVLQETAGRLPFSAAEAEIRYLEADDVRQGETVKRELIVVASHRPVIERTVQIVERAGMRPVAVDIEPAALVRCYARQFRRDVDRQQRIMLVHVGASNTAAIIARGDDPLFLKYIDVGGRHLDDAVARHLKMNLAEAAQLRKHNGDRRAELQDPEVARSVAEAVRPVLDRLTNELSLCLRYHSVTFRGQPITRLVLGGGEASAALVEFFQPRMDLSCELGEPLRSFEPCPAGGRKSQWDVAAGLALRQSA